MKSAFVFLPLALCAACGDSTFPSPQPVDVAVTSQTTSQREPLVTTISFVVTNRTTQVVYIPSCGDRVSVELERRQDGSWINAGAAICLANLPMGPMPLGPRGFIRSEVAVAGTGSFRLRTGVTANPATAMDWNIYSPTFGIQ